MPEQNRLLTLGEVTKALGFVPSILYGDLANVLEAQREMTLREVGEWGEQPCIEHSEVEWPAEIGGGIAKRQKVKRRRCQHCWRALKQGKLGG